MLNANEFFGERALLFKEKINYKYPNGGGFDPHQDAAAYDFGDFHITCLIAPKPTSIENGCLFIAQNEHRRGLLAYMRGPLASTFNVKSPPARRGTISLSS